MKHDLQTLIRLRDWRVDEEKRALEQRLRGLDDLHAQARRFELELKAEQEAARAAPEEAGMAYANYARRAHEHRVQLAQSIIDAEAAIAVAREALGEAYRDLKTVELAHENRQQRQVAEAERRQAIALDEIALQGFHRGSGKS